MHQAGGLSASIRVDGDAVHTGIVLGGARDALSDIGKTAGRLPVTEAFRADGGASWGTPPPQGSAQREQWFLSNEVAHAQARQYLAAEVVEQRDLLARFVADWVSREGG